MGKIAFSIGNLDFYWYGMIIALSVMAAFAVNIWQARLLKKPLLPVVELSVIGVLFALIGARLYYVFFNWDFYGVYPLESIHIWRGGFAIHGAIIGLIAGFYFYTRKKRLPFWTWADIFTPGFALGQAIGQWANLVNQEAFGYPTGVPWGIYIDFSYRPAGYEQFDYYQPVFLYESLWNFLLFALFLFLVVVNRRNRKIKHGSGFVLYLLLFMGGKFVFDGLRLGSEVLETVRTVQFAVMCAVVILAFFWIKNDYYSRRF